MQASLPMYDLPEVRAATDGWWAALARALCAAGLAGVPATLRRPAAREDVWRAPDLLLTQTCGYPLRFAFAGVLRAVAAPVHAVPGCEGHRYASALVVREADADRAFEDFRGRILAANAPDSQSGCNCVRHLAAPLARDGRFFAGVRWCGAHRDSLAAVRAGEADIAAVDPVTYALVARHAPREVAGLAVIGHGPAVPALPYAVRASAPADDVARVRDALRAAFADPHAAACRETLRLGGAVDVDDADYDPVVAMHEEARARGYRELDGDRHG